MIIVLTTLGADSPAESFAEELVERRLAACVNIVEKVRSIYRWQGAIEHDDEKLLVIKTTDERLAELRDYVLANHPYSVPELVILRGEVEGPYGDWLTDAVARSPRQ